MNTCHHFWGTYKLVINTPIYNNNKTFEDDLTDQHYVARLLRDDFLRRTV